MTADDGQTAVEFALVAPLLVVLLLAVIQIGLAFNHYVTLTDAARAGARKAVVARFSGASIGDVEQAVRSAASDLDQTQLGIQVADPTWNVPGSDVTVTVTYPYSIGLLGWVVASGNLTSTMTERLE
ncbi:MAG TPA: TadE/TadG family type IV pilus assembly protein [Gaiellaceae bacterium]|nr:TadE/TadG family type IV pilus assembly protein [Gaiellaceae bacterium]